MVVKERKREVERESMGKMNGRKMEVVWLRMAWAEVDIRTKDTKLIGMLVVGEMIGSRYNQWPMAVGGKKCRRTQCPHMCFLF